jgi:hypothetical protein
LLPGNRVNKDGVETSVFCSLSEVIALAHTSLLFLADFWQKPHYRRNHAFMVVVVISKIRLTPYNIRN